MIFKRMRDIFFIKRHLLRFAIIILVGLGLLSVIYISLRYRGQQFLARRAFFILTERTARFDRGSLPFLIEEQRRAIFELSQSFYMRDLIIFARGQSGIGERQLLKMESFIHAYQKHFGYKQVLLLNDQGYFVFSTVPDLYGKNIKQELYKESAILDSFRLVRMTLTSDITVYRYDPIVQQKALFVTMPVFYDEKLNGYLVVQLDTDEIERILARDLKFAPHTELSIIEQVRDKKESVLISGAQTHNSHDHKEYNDDYFINTLFGHEGYGISQDGKQIQLYGFVPQLNWAFLIKHTYLHKSIL